jgi:hypothetical protein
VVSLASADDRLNLLSLALLSGVTGHVSLLLRSCAARRTAIACPGHAPPSNRILSPWCFRAVASCQAACGFSAPETCKISLDLWLTIVFVLLL